jgi:Protein of unknown function (DUF3592)
MENSETSFTSIAIDGAATYAKFRAVWGIIITFFIFCLTTYFGYSIYSTEDIYGSNVINGKVKDSTCTRNYKYDENTYNNNYRYDKNTQDAYDCSFNVLYNIDNNEYLKNQHTNNSMYYNPGSSVSLRYNKNDKTDVTMDTFTNSFKGKLIMFIGLFLLIGSLIYLYVIFNYKSIAVADTAINLISGTFNNRRY